MYALNNIYNCALEQMYKQVRNSTEGLKSRGHVELAIHHFLKVSYQLCSLFGKA